jgi:hypothetical protein
MIARFDTDQSRMDKNRHRKDSTEWIPAVLIAR